MRKPRDKDFRDWCDAFVEQGLPPSVAVTLAEECVTWFTNNDDMDWQACFDAVLLEYETKGCEE